MNVLFLVDAVAKGFSAGLEDEDGKKAAMVNNVSISVCMNFGFMTFPFFFGNIKYG